MNLSRRIAAALTLALTCSGTAYASSASIVLSAGPAPIRAASQILSGAHPLWIEVYQDPQTQIRIDENSITTDHRIAQATHELREGANSPMRATLRIDHFTVQARYDCDTAGRFQLISVIGAREGTGEPIQLGPNTTWQTVKGGEPEAGLWRAACKVKL